MPVIADEIYAAAAASGARPDPLLTISEWADRYRALSPQASAEPGPWRTDRTPYLREIMDCLSPSSPVERVIFMKGSQIGGTECGNNWIGYIIHQAPGPMMAVQPTVEMAKRNSKQRIDPLIESSAVLRKLVSSPRSRDSGNTVLAKEFPGGLLVLTGANSGVGLRSMAARYLFWTKSTPTRAMWTEKEIQSTWRSPAHVPLPGARSSSSRLRRSQGRVALKPLSPTAIKGATGCRVRIVESIRR